MRRLLETAVGAYFLGCCFFGASVLCAQTTAVESLDLDGDTLGDVWEFRYGQELVAGEDTDGDGQSNVREANAGTDPLDPNDYAASFTWRLDSEEMWVYWPSIRGKRYQVYLNDSLDEENWVSAGEPVEGTGDPLSTRFRIYQGERLRGSLNMDTWYGINLWGLDYFQEQAAYPDQPSEREWVEGFDLPDSGDEDFFRRFYGYVIPPVSGDYRFWIASDDYSQLYLSNEESELNKVLICEVDEWVGYREFDELPGQQSAWISLDAGRAYFIEAIMLDWGWGDHISVAWEGPGMERQVIGGEYLSPVSYNPEDNVLMNDRHFIRIGIEDQDSDADGASDWEELQLGFDPKNPRSQMADEDDGAYLAASLASTNRVSVIAYDESASESEDDYAVFRFYRTGNLDPITVNYAIGGSAQVGEDYASLSGSVAFALGQREAFVWVRPVSDAFGESTESVSLSLVDDEAYDPGDGPTDASIYIDDAEPVSEFYIASLRPPASAAQSLASGTVSLHLSPYGNHGMLALQFSNLSSDEFAGEILQVLEASETGIREVPLGQFKGEHWHFATTDGYDAVSLLEALEAGEVMVRLSSSGFPGGELEGVFALATGSLEMPLPAAPPAVDLENLTAEAASRFLQQATFGPTMTDIEHLQSIGIEAWLDEQAALPFTSHLSYVQAVENTGQDVYQVHRRSAWIDRSLHAPDQLRQRVAFALSEIFVISERNSGLEGAPMGMAHYYDQLGEHAFGNFRDLLETVSLSPMMGQYLSSLRNAKADPEAGTRADENYAREVMQLFSIGLNELHPDGSYKLGVDAQPINTYDQTDVSEMAKVFTGWSYRRTSDESWTFWWGDYDPYSPMEVYHEFHDDSEKVIVGDVVIPANQGGDEDMRIALDALFHHPNVGPFIAKALIQRLVTSNPSPGYIYRVGQVFNDDGNGVRGNLLAVVRAVLTDWEARSSVPSEYPGFGKLREPLVRVIHAWRLFEASSASNLYLFWGLDSDLGQSPLRSPTVFNFYDPAFSLSGTIADAGLVAPEFQITNESTTMSYGNFVYALANGWHGGEEDHIDLNMSSLETLAANPASLADYLNIVLMAGRMSDEIRSSIIAVMEAENDVATRVQRAVHLLLLSPAFAVER